MSIRLRGPASAIGALLTFAPNPHYYLAPTTLLQNGGINASVVFNAPGGTLRFLVVRHRIQRYGRADDHVGCPVIGVLACASGIYSEASSSTLSVFASTTVITIKKSHTIGQTATVSIAFAHS